MSSEALDKVLLSTPLVGIEEVVYDDIAGPPCLEYVLYDLEREFSKELFRLRALVYFLQVRASLVYRVS